ncbi:hypothetical protein O181_000786 [Austropuccinia psidii MF-1]|uniref:Uncharacterized protein n=1 Tax=Austropuccinia psidii MF-1 TaxID=1389203 RepID=A0A9Q3B956_9BASI|nr:hypothetical protein [Austropuccinia psidii MF-1]
MEATIQYNQMDLEKEEARPVTDLESLPQERHIWRMPELLHSPMSVPTTFDINPEPERSQRGHALLPTHQELSGSGADHKTLSRMESLVLQGKGQKDEELVEEPKFFIHRQEERVGNDPRFGERRTSSVNLLQTSSRTAQRTSEETERSHKKSRQGKRKSKWAQKLPTGVQDSQIGTLSCGKCVQYGQNPYGVHSKGTGKDEEDFSMKIIDEIRIDQSIMDSRFNKIKK